MDAKPAAKTEVAKSEAANYERLGRAVEEALVKEYVALLHNTRRQVWSSFIRGVFAGLGGVVGATIGAALLVALLVALGHIPMIGHWFTQAGQTIEGYTTHNHQP